LQLLDEISGATVEQAMDKKKEAAAAKATKKYAAPKLTVYGAMSKLTAGGTGNNNENAAGSSPQAWRP